jgi:type IV pilus assembly protein PilW
MRWNKGFTLVEILIAIAIAGVVMAGIYSAYSSQQRSYIVQEQVAGMQQNLRAAMDLMEREIRMAGYDPTGGAGAKIITADIAELQFRIDVNGDGDFTKPGSPPGNDTNEQIRYALKLDADRDGIADGSPCGLGRATWGSGLMPVAENIDALNFVYLDKDGNPTTTLEEIRSVQIALVARTGRGDPRYKDTAIYRNQRGAVVLPQQNDNFRRKLLTAQVNCRNLAF